MLNTAIDALAAFRLTRLITQDTFPPVRKVRDAILDRYPDQVVGLQNHNVPVGMNVEEGQMRVAIEEVTVPEYRPQWIAELIECPWCMGMWVAFGVVGLRRLAPKFWGPMATALALSATTGLISTWENAD